MSLPGKVAVHRSPSITILTIVKRFEFAPQLLRSGAIVCSSVDPPDQMLFFVRGAPATIEQLVHHGSLPHDYRQVSVLFAYAKHLTFTALAHTAIVSESWALRTM